MKPSCPRMWRLPTLGAILALLSTPWPAAGQVTCTQTVADYATFTTCTSTLPDGAQYGSMVPDDWNGSLVLFSQPYIPPGQPVGSLFGFVDSPTRRWLLENGFALAGSYTGSGWVIRDALRDQIETLDLFASQVGTPSRTIAYGGSGGGLIAAGLVQQHPERFSGALSVAGPLAGTVAWFNAGLDLEFVIQQLLGLESGLQIVRITDAAANVTIAQQLLSAAQATPEGRARIALACAVADIGGWYSPLSPEPAADDYAAQEANQYLWLSNPLFLTVVFGAGHVDRETRAGGNASWNTDVNYEKQLENSVCAAEVQALYAAAGLDLEADLARLNAAPRVAADPAAVQYATEGIVFDGDLGGVPVLAVHAIGDGFVMPQNEFAYRSVVLEAMDGQLLRQVFVHRAGHGNYTPAEVIAAFQALLHRIDAGKWDGSTETDALNAAASALGPFYNVLLLGGRIATLPAFVDYEPAPFPRPYDLGDPIPAAAARQLASARSEGSPLAGARLAAWPLPNRGGSLSVSFAAEEGRRATVAIYDLAGRRVRRLEAGVESSLLRWDGRDERGNAVRNGVYFLRASGGRQAGQLKLVVMR